MQKLITHLLIILIGLSILSIQFSCTLFNIDDSPVKYSDRYINNTNQEVKLVFKSSIEGDSDFIIPSGDYIDRIKITWTDDDNTIQRFINELYGTDSDEPIIQLILDTEIIKLWNGPPASMGDNNNPFNYDSWEVNDNENVVEFTINNTDLD